jgi:hypothetical protein
MYSQRNAPCIAVPSNRRSTRWRLVCFNVLAYVWSRIGFWALILICMCMRIAMVGGIPAITKCRAVESQNSAATVGRKGLHDVSPSKHTAPIAMYQHHTAVFARSCPVLQPKNDTRFRTQRLASNTPPTNIAHCSLQLAHALSISSVPFLSLNS